MMDKKALVDDIELFVLDMDGTFYLGDRILEGSLEFLDKVKKAGKDFVFFTNNSSKSPTNYIDKLKKMNCFITREKIMTSGDVTIGYLKTHHPEKSVYLVGTPALEESFLQEGIPLFTSNQKDGEIMEGQQRRVPDIVVIGFDTTLTYEKLERACTYIRNGAMFLATHLDINCPTEAGFIPDCGAMCDLIRKSTGAEPKYLGKPFFETMEYVLGKTGYKKEHIAFVGDRLYTDVATGVKNGAKGILVLSGETKLSDVEGSDVIPDGIFEDLKEIGTYL